MNYVSRKVGAASTLLMSLLLTAGCTVEGEKPKYDCQPNHDRLERYPYLGDDDCRPGGAGGPTSQGVPASSGVPAY